MTFVPHDQVKYFFAFFVFFFFKFICPLRMKDRGDHAQSRDPRDAGLWGPPNMNGGLMGGPPLPALLPYSSRSPSEPPSTPPHLSDLPSCFSTILRHFARAFWNHTCNQKQTKSAINNNYNNNNNNNNNFVIIVKEVQKHCRDIKISIIEE